MRFFLSTAVGFFFICYAAIGIFAQTGHKVDSLFLVVQKNPRDSFNTALYNFYRGYRAYEESRYDSAIHYLQLSTKSAERLKNDTLLIKALNLAGDAWSDKGDNPRALKLYQQAVEVAIRSGNREMEARIIKNIGVLYVSWQKLNLARNHYDSALQIAKELGNKALIADCKNNLGVVEEISENYPAAIDLYNEALEYYKSIGKKESIAMVFSNLAIAYKYSGNLPKSIEYNKNALELAREMKDRWKEAATLNNIGSAYLKMNEPAVSYRFAKESVALSNEIGAREILQYAYETMAEAAYALGSFKEASDYLKKMVAVKDSFINLESTRQVAELQTKFETAQKEHLIEQQKLELKNKNYQISALVLGLGLIGVAGYAFYRREKHKEEKARQELLLRQREEATKAVLNAEEAERRRIAAELHDGVGQLMSVARMNLEAFAEDLGDMGPEQKNRLGRVVNLVDEGCKEVRAVSHSMMPNALLKNGLAAALHEFIQKLDHGKLKTHLHIEGLHDRLPSETESVLYRIIQECVNNVIKHSGADILDISILREEETVTLTIEDNGKGFDLSEAASGIGLQNIQARVHFLKGSMDIETAPGKGTFIAIYIPAA